MEFGNKMVVLSGDFLLVNVCIELVILNNIYVRIYRLWIC